MIAEPMTAEAKVRDALKYPNGPLKNCYRAAFADLVVSLMEEHAAAAVAQLTRERDELRARVAVRHREDQKWWGEQLRHTFACFADIQRKARAFHAYTGIMQDSVERAHYRRDRAERERDEARAALERLRAAARDMLTGVHVHNERHVGPGREAQRIEGPVIEALRSAIDNKRK